MARKPYVQIREAESEAQVIIENALEEQKRIVERAKEESADAFLRGADSCKQHVAEKHRQAEADAACSSEKAAQETAELCFALEKELSLKKPEAVDAVIRMIIA